MKSAPLIVVAEIQSASLVSTQPREVNKPDTIGGPMVLKIPLHLAKIAARVLLRVRGSAPDEIEFYSWVWASGKHGGPRLFQVNTGTVHVLFLRHDSGYMHTVCDYPNCDLQMASDYTTAFLATWHAGYEQSLPVPERLVAVRLKGAFEGAHDDSSDHWLSMYELVDLTRPSFVLEQLESLCHNLTNPLGRKFACSTYTEESRDPW